MVVEIKGQQIRIRILNPRIFSKFRTQDVGRKGRLQRISAFSKKTKWVTQAWRLNLKGYRGLKDITRTIRRLRIRSSLKKRAIILANKAMIKIMLRR